MPLDPAGAAIVDGVSLLRAMHARYAGRWFRTLRFHQTVAWADDGGAPRPPEVWAEHVAPPGRLRIDFAGGTGDGVLYADGRRYVFRAGAVESAPRRRSPWVLLSFDAYAQPAGQTAAFLEEEGFALGPLRRDVWEGKPVYVVGAASREDARSPQFWVEEERLLPVRIVEPSREDPSRITDVRFGGYLPAGGGWVATRVVFLLDGREAIREDYSGVEADVELSPALFDPARWSEMAP